MPDNKQLYLTLVLTLLSVGLCLSEVLYNTSACFKLPVVYEEQEPNDYDYGASGTYKYILQEMPGQLNVSLSCPNNDNLVRVEDITYSIPAAMDDYCLDKDIDCTSMTEPCHCCRKPQEKDNTTVCSHHSPRNETYICSGHPSNCILVIPAVTFTKDMCAHLTINCREPDYCKSRWVDIKYSCRSVVSDVKLPEKHPDAPKGISVKTRNGIIIGTVLTIVAIAVILGIVGYVAYTRSKNTTAV